MTRTAFIKTRIWPIVCAVAILLGLLGTGGLLFRRGRLESRDKTVLVAMSYSDVLRLGDALGQSPDQLLPDLATVGVQAIILTGIELSDENGLPLATVQAAGLPYAVQGAAATAIPADALFYIPDPLLLTDTEQAEAAAAITARKLPLALVENEAQTGLILPDAFVSYSGEQLTGYRLWEGKASTFGKLGYDGPEEISNTFFRAAAERGCTFLWLAPFLQGENIVIDLSAYDAMLDELFTRLADYGITPGLPTTTTPFAVSTFFLILAAWSVIAAVLIPLFSREKLRPAGLVLLAIALLGVIILALVSTRLLQLLTAFAAAVIGPCWAIWVFVWFLRRISAKPSHLLRLILQTIIALVASFALALLGGLVAAAVFADSEFLLGLASFRGVKFSQLIPLGFAALLVFVLIYHERERSLAGDLRALFHGFRRHALLKCSLLVLLLGVLIAVFLLRTGHVDFSIPVIEQRLRNFLENVFYARPRTKEFLVAYPAFFATFWSAARGVKPLILPFAVLSAIGFSSVANTFCHGRAEVLLSVSRAWNGCMLGLAIALVLLLGVEGIWWLWKRHKARKSAAESDTAEAETATEA